MVTSWPLFPRVVFAIATVGLHLAIPSHVSKRSRPSVTHRRAQYAKLQHHGPEELCGTCEKSGEECKARKFSDALRVAEQRQKIQLELAEQSQGCSQVAKLKWF